MRYLWFPGCKIAHHLPQYGVSTKAVCKALGIELVELEFGCCGWPARHESFLASMLSAARNLALAKQHKTPILTPCKCCFGNLKHAQARLRSNEKLAKQVALTLAEEGLSLALDGEISHLLTVLDRAMGVGALQANVVRPLSGVKVACHYGCHALRPADVTEFDDPLAPTMFQRVIAALGAAPVPWELSLECCGHPLRGRDDTISNALMRKKLENASAAGADVVATGCTYCQLQFDSERCKTPGVEAPPAVLVSQLVGLALGLEEQMMLENNANHFDITRF